LCKFTANKYNTILREKWYERSRFNIFNLWLLWTWTFSRKV
jgi:hypothetical protein